MSLRMQNRSCDQLVQAMGILFSLSAIGLSLALGYQGLLSLKLGGLLALALIPAFVGMYTLSERIYVGQQIRQRISAALFHPLFYITLELLGMYIIVGNQ